MGGNTDFFIVSGQEYGAAVPGYLMECLIPYVPEASLPPVPMTLECKDTGPQDTTISFYFLILRRCEDELRYSELLRYCLIHGLLNGFV